MFPKKWEKLSDFGQFGVQFDDFACEKSGNTVTFSSTLIQVVVFFANKDEFFCGEIFSS